MTSELAQWEAQLDAYDEQIRRVEAMVSGTIVTLVWLTPPELGPIPLELRPRAIAMRDRARLVLTGLRKRQSQLGQERAYTAR